MLLRIAMVSLLSRDYILHWINHAYLLHLITVLLNDDLPGCGEVLRLLRSIRNIVTFVAGCMCGYMLGGGIGASDASLEAGPRSRFLPRVAPPPRWMRVGVGTTHQGS